MSAQAKRPTARQLGLNPRALGINPKATGTNARALGVNPRALDERGQEAPQQAAQAARRTVELRRTVGIPGCRLCGGTGWAETETNTVAECDCRQGVIA